MNNKINSLSDLISTAESSTSTQVVSGSGSKYSFSIVNSQNNGKRLSFSKSLATDIGLTDTVFILPSVASGEIFVTSSSISGKCSKAPLSGADKKLCYSTPLVKMIVSAFGLNFAGHTSMSFPDVTIEDFGDVKVARISMAQPVAEAQVQTESETEA